MLNRTGTWLWIFIMGPWANHGLHGFEGPSLLQGAGNTTSRFNPRGRLTVRGRKKPESDSSGFTSQPGTTPASAGPRWVRQACPELIMPPPIWASTLPFNGEKQVITFSSWSLWKILGSTAKLGWTQASILGRSSAQLSSAQLSSAEEARAWGGGFVSCPVAIPGCEPGVGGSLQEIKGLGDASGSVHSLLLNPIFNSICRAGSPGLTCTHARCPDFSGQDFLKSIPWASAVFSKYESVAVLPCPRARARRVMEGNFYSVLTA